MSDAWAKYLWLVQNGYIDANGDGQFSNEEYAAGPNNPYQGSTHTLPSNAATAPPAVIQGLLDRGMSLDQAIAQNQSAVNQGGDLDGDGFVTNQEWYDFQNPPAQNTGNTNTGGTTTGNTPTDITPTNPNYTGGGDIYQNPGDFNASDQVADDPWWHSAAGNPQGADEIIPSDLLQIYEQFTKLMGESGVDLNQVVADGGIQMASQLFQNNVTSGAIDPNTIDPAIYQTLGLNTLYNPVLQDLIDGGMSYQDAIAHNQNALSQREGVDVDEDGYVSDEEWANWQDPETASDDGWLDDVLGSILDDDLNGWLEDLGDVLNTGKSIWEDKGAQADDWVWYEKDGQRVFGPPTGNEGDTTGSSGGTTGGTSGGTTGGTSGGNDGNTWGAIGDWIGGLFGGGDSEGDNVGFKEFLGGLFGGGGTGTGIGGVIVNTAASNYAMDKYKDMMDDQIDFNQGIYDDNVARLDPYNQMGLNNLVNAQSQANYKPVMRDLAQGNFSLNPDTNVQGPSARDFSNSGPTTFFGPQAREISASNDMYAAPQSRTDEIRATTDVGPAQAREVKVNQTNLLDATNPYLQAMQNESLKQIQDAGVAAGKYKSGQTMEALNDSTMANYARLLPTLQGIESSRDSMNLAANNQLFNQWQTSQDFRLNRDLANIQNRLGKDAQRFSQGMAAQQFNRGQSDQNLQNQLATDAQRYGQQLGSAQFGSDQDYRNFLARLNADQQRYGQELGSAQFGQGQQNQNFANRLLANDQQYNQKLQENNQKLFNDQQSFNQFYQLLGGGQNAAAGQGGYGNALMTANAGAMQGKADITGDFYTGLLKSIFGMGA